jgi:hypothetical protein
MSKKVSFPLKEIWGYSEQAHPPGHTHHSWVHSGVENLEEIQTFVWYCTILKSFKGVEPHPSLTPSQ